MPMIALKNTGPCGLLRAGFLRFQHEHLPLTEHILSGGLEFVKTFVIRLITLSPKKIPAGKVFWME
jgi:hypothetical protein